MSMKKLKRQSQETHPSGSSDKKQRRKQKVPMRLEVVQVTHINEDVGKLVDDVQEEHDSTHVLDQIVQDDQLPGPSSQVVPERPEDVQISQSQENNNSMEASRSPSTSSLPPLLPSPAVRADVSRPLSVPIETPRRSTRKRKLPLKLKENLESLPGSSRETETIRLTHMTATLQSSILRNYEEFRLRHEIMDSVSHVQSISTSVVQQQPSTDHEMEHEDDKEQALNQQEERVEQWNAAAVKIEIKTELNSETSGEIGNVEQQREGQDLPDYQPAASLLRKLKIEPGTETNGEEEVEKPVDQKPPSNLYNDQTDNSEEICQNPPGSSEGLSLSFYSIICNLFRSNHSSN